MERVEQEIVYGMELFDDVVDWVEWMILIGKQDFVEELVKNMENVFVLQDVGEYSCNHKMNHAKFIDKTGGGYIEIDMAALTHWYSIMDYASKTLQKKYFEPYL